MAIDVSAGRLWRGAAAGVLASMVMGMYAMVASLYHDTGFLTPLYHIASSVGSPTAMMDSMKAAMGGDGTFFAAGPALVGAVIHMMVGAVAGVVFVLIASLRSFPARVVIVAGVGFGLVVMLVNALVVLPLTARVLGGGDPVADMATVVGWGTFTVEHALFGLVLGALVAGTTWSRAPRQAERTTLVRPKG
jgi:uncharacterized membrane protein YagU involved in acid resistance